MSRISQTTIDGEGDFSWREDHKPAEAATPANPETEGEAVKQPEGEAEKPADGTDPAKLP